MIAAGLAVSSSMAVPESRAVIAAVAEIGALPRRAAGTIRSAPAPGAAASSLRISVRTGDTVEATVARTVAAASLRA